MHLSFTRTILPRDKASSAHSTIGLYFFLAEQITGLVALLAVVFTVLLSSRVRRNTVWINFMVTGILYTLSYLVLSFAGQQSGPEPSFTVCITQAALVYAAPPLCAFASLSLILQLWFDLSATSAAQRRPLRTAILLIMPYFVHVTVAVEALAFGLHDKNSVYRKDSSIYCAISTGIPGRVSAILVALALGAGLVFQVLIGRTLLRGHRILSQSTSSAPAKAVRALRGMMARSSVFTLVVFASIGVSVVFFTQAKESEVPNVAIGAMPLLAFLVFGTQRDIFSVRMFWKKGPVKPGPSALSGEKSVA